MDLLNKPWLRDEVKKQIDVLLEKRAQYNRQQGKAQSVTPSDYIGARGELVIPSKGSKYLQIGKWTHYSPKSSHLDSKPTTAILSDKFNTIPGEFTDTCVREFEKSYEDAITKSTRGNVIRLLEYEVVLIGSDGHEFWKNISYDDQCRMLKKGAKSNSKKALDLETLQTARFPVVILRIHQFKRITHDQSVMFSNPSELKLNIPVLRALPRMVRSKKQRPTKPSRSVNRVVVKEKEILTGNEDDYSTSGLEIDIKSQAATPQKASEFKPKRIAKLEDDDLDKEVIAQMPSTQQYPWKSSKKISMFEEDDIDDAAISQMPFATQIPIDFDTQWASTWTPSKQHKQVFHTPEPNVPRSSHSTVTAATGYSEGMKQKGHCTKGLIRQSPLMSSTSHSRDSSVDYGANGAKNVAGKTYQKGISIPNSQGTEHVVHAVNSSLYDTQVSANAKKTSGRLQRPLKPIRMLPLASTLLMHPGWRGMREVTRADVTIPKDQQTKLDDPSAWFTESKLSTFNRREPLVPVELQREQRYETSARRVSPQPHDEPESLNSDEPLPWSSSRSVSPDIQSLDGMPPDSSAINPPDTPVAMEKQALPASIEGERNTAVKLPQTNKSPLPLRKKGTSKPLKIDQTHKQNESRDASGKKKFQKNGKLVLKEETKSLVTTTESDDSDEEGVLMVNPSGMTGVAKYGLLRSQKLLLRKKEKKRRQQRLSLGLPEESDTEPEPSSIELEDDCSSSSDEKEARRRSFLSETSGAAETTEDTVNAELQPLTVLGGQTLRGGDADILLEGARRAINLPYNTSCSFTEQSIGEAHTVPPMAGASNITSKPEALLTPKGCAISSNRGIPATHAAPHTENDTPSKALLNSVQLNVSHALADQYRILSSTGITRKVYSNCDDDDDEDDEDDEIPVAEPIPFISTRSNVAGLQKASDTTAVKVNVPSREEQKMHQPAVATAKDAETRSSSRPVSHNKVTDLKRLNRGSSPIIGQGSSLNKNSVRNVSVVGIGSDSSLDIGKGVSVFNLASREKLPLKDGDSEPNGSKSDHSAFPSTAPSKLIATVQVVDTPHAVLRHAELAKASLKKKYDQTYDDYERIPATASNHASQGSEPGAKIAATATPDFLDSITVDNPIKSVTPKKSEVPSNSDSASVAPGISSGRPTSQTFAVVIPVSRGLKRKPTQGSVEAGRNHIRKKPHVKKVEFGSQETKFKDITEVVREQKRKYIESLSGGSGQSSEKGITSLALGVTQEVVNKGDIHDIHKREEPKELPRTEEIPPHAPHLSPHSLPSKKLPQTVALITRPMPGPRPSSTVSTSPRSSTPSASKFYSSRHRDPPQRESATQRALAAILAREGLVPSPAYEVYISNSSKPGSPDTATRLSPAPSHSSRYSRSSINKPSHRVIKPDADRRSSVVRTESELLREQPGSHSKISLDRPSSKKLISLPSITDAASSLQKTSVETPLSQQSLRDPLHFFAFDDTEGDTDDILPAKQPVITEPVQKTLIPPRYFFEFIKKEKPERISDYAGIPGRDVDILIPGYNKLSQHRKKKLNDWRQDYFGPGEVGSNIPTTEDVAAEEPEDARRSRWDEERKREGRAKEWWEDEDAPIRLFKKKLEAVKSVRRELDGEGKGQVTVKVDLTGLRRF